VLIVLASGRGERFRASGGTVHKLQAPLAGRPVIEHTLAAARDSGLPWHLEDAGHAGMGDSIASAVRATEGAAGWLILPADLPLVRPASIRAVAIALGSSGEGERLAVTPWRGETRGHPVGFSAACGADLRALSGDRGAAPVLQALQAQGRVRRVALDDPGIVTDIDTLDDLARAEAVLRLRRAGQPD
jgi:molybdenum cofactor cytidylyltransferase